MSRTRSAPFCAIAVDRGTSVDEQEGTSKNPSNRRLGSGPGSKSAHDIDGAAAATEASRGQWYGIQEVQKERGVVSTPPAQSGGGAGPGTAQKQTKGGKRATKHRWRSDKKAKGGKAAKGGKGAKAGMTNPTIGKSNLDTIIGASAKGTPGGIPGLFGGDVERAQQSSAAAAAAEAATEEALAKAAAEVEEEEEDDEARLTFTTRWRRRITFVARTVQIWAFLFHVLIKLLRQKLVQMDEERMSRRRRKLGRYLCKAFLKLGPTFIKIGQVCAVCHPVCRLGQSKRRVGGKGSCCVCIKPVETYTKSQGVCGGIQVFRSW